MKRYRNLTPRMIHARFNSVCAETGKPIRTGEEMLYAYGKAYHIDSKHAQAHLVDHGRIVPHNVDRECFNLDSMIENDLMARGY